METFNFKENEVLTGISILAVLKYTHELELSKCMLIEPLLSYSIVESTLKRAKSNIRSIEELIIRENVVFSNFNSRFREHFALSMNSILLFSHMGLITIKENRAIFTGNAFDFNNQLLGKKAAARIKAAKKLSEILLKGDASELYLSLRVEL